MKYGWRNNKLRASEVTADSVVSDALNLQVTTVSTAATGTAAYIPVTVNGVTYYIEGKL